MAEKLPASDVMYYIVINGADTCVRYNRTGRAKNIVDFLLPRFPMGGSVGDEQKTSWSGSGKLSTNDVYRLFSIVDDMKRAEKARMGSRAWREWRDSDYDYAQKITADLYVGGAHQFVPDFDHPDKLLPATTAIHLKDADISIRAIRAAFNAIDGDLGAVLDGRVKAMKPLKLKAPA